MGIFDRWNSNKGKAVKVAPTKGATADDAKKRAFASVPTGESKADESKKKSADQPATTVPAERESESVRAHAVLFRPLVTEKTSRVPGQYTFDVDPNATKADVRQAVEELYGIRPVAVNISRLDGKVIRYGRFSGRTNKRKKAIITLPAGKTIDVMST